MGAPIAVHDAVNSGIITCQAIRKELRLIHKLVWNTHILKEHPLDASVVLERSLQQTEHMPHQASALYIHHSASS